MLWVGQNSEKLLSGAQELVHPFPTRAFPKQQEKVDPPGTGLAVRLRKGLPKELRSVCREKIEWRSRPTVSFWGRGAQRMGSLGTPKKPVETLGRVEQPSYGPGLRAAPRPSLTFQREAAARVVLPRAWPHHPGHSSGQRGHPGGSFAWKLYPGEGEIERQARLLATLGNSPERGEPLPKKAGERGRDAGRRTASPERGSRSNRGKGRAGRPQSPGSRAQGGKVWCESERVALSLGALGRGL